MSNSVCPLIAKTALGPILILSLIVYTNTLCNFIALSRNYTSPAYNRPNAGSGSCVLKDSMRGEIQETIRHDYVGGHSEEERPTMLVWPYTINMSVK